MIEPIVIVGTPRSFTSLTSGIFRDHGVWFGRCKEYHEYCPTGSCENMRMKTILKANRNRCVFNGEVVDHIEGYKGMIDEIMSEEGYSDGPHAWKHSAMFYKVWEEFKPKYVCCRRPKEAVLASGVRTNMYAANGDSWDKHQEVMDKLVDDGLAVNVYGEKYFEGDWSDLQNAFEFCGLEFKQEVAENLLDHKHKHF